MPGSHPTRWIVLLLCGALGCVGSTDAPAGETGSLSLDLVLAGGIEIDEVTWQITGNDMDMSGDIDVSAPGSTASVEVFGLPPGEEDYTVTLTATSTDQAVSCQGSAPFNVEVGQSTDVMVMLNCKKPRTLGGVRVNGEFNICTQLTKAVVSPLETSVGNDISLSAQAFDEEGDDIHYIWSGDGGSIADPSAASTTYTCQEVGDHTVMIMVTDNDVYCRMATWTIPVNCVEGDGGDLCEDVICEDDGNECTESACNPADGACETSNVEDGTDCDGGAGTCSGGQCVEVDLCEGVDCNDNNECTADACDPADGTCANTNVDDGTPCADETGMCVDGSCMITDLCEGVVCDDTGNECTVAMCNTTTGECDTMNVADGTACNGGVGACAAGVCIDNNPCQGVDCSSDNDCVQDGTCDPADGLCDPGDPQPADTACDLAGTDDGFCDGAGACVACNADAQCPDDGNECTAATCTSNACSSSPVTDGTECDADGSAGVCMSGVCEDAMLCADAGTRCDDGNECTQDLCDPATGNCSNPAEPDGSQCTCPVCGAEGVCDMGVCVDPCDGVDCSDGNQCTADLCNVGVCSNPNVGPGAACDQDGGNVCDGTGTCVECINDNQCSGSEVCTANVCVPGAIDQQDTKTIQVACTNGATTTISILDFELSAGPAQFLSGQPVSLPLDGKATFTRAFLDVGLGLFGDLQEAEVQTLQVTAQAKAGLTGPDPVFGIDTAELTRHCTLAGFADPCTILCDTTASCTAAGECPGAGFGNQCADFGVVPTTLLCDSTGGRGGDGTCDNACGPGGFCETSTPLDAVTLEPVGVGQCVATAGASPGSYCILGDAEFGLAEITADFTVGASGDVLLGWYDDDGGCPLNNDGTYVGPPGATPPYCLVPQAPVVTPTPPIGLTVVAGPAPVAIDCIMAINSGEATCSSGDRAGLPCSIAPPELQDGTNAAGPAGTNSDCPPLTTTGGVPDHVCVPTGRGVSACVGGTNNGVQCTGAGDCPGGDCRAVPDKASPTPVEGLIQFNIQGP